MTNWLELNEPSTVDVMTCEILNLLDKDEKDIFMLGLGYRKAVLTQMEIDSGLNPSPSDRELVSNIKEALKRQNLVWFDEVYTEDSKR